MLAVLLALLIFMGLSLCLALSSCILHDAAVSYVQVVVNDQISHRFCLEVQLQ
jgi:hypothetical protein